MVDRPTIRLIHHLPRAGGTAICKCLGAMNDVTLLSEIHPSNMQLSAKVIFHKGKLPTFSALDPSDKALPAETFIFNALYQACYWFRLVRPQELSALSRDLDFVGILALIAQRASERGDVLVIREWSYVDFWAKPFVPEPTFRLRLPELLGERFELKQAFTVRHPLDQWLSWRNFDSEDHLGLDLETFMLGCRRFAEIAARRGFHRYEDFTRQPSGALAQICEDLDVPFDEGYVVRWFNYRTITGDVSSTRGTDEIVPLKRRPVDPATLEAVSSNRDYQATLELLGYED
jgi:hypothetical protein